MNIMNLCRAKAMGKLLEGWIDGWYFCLYGHHYILKTDASIWKPFSTDKAVISDFTEVIPETVCQILDKTDINNKSICENDDIKVRYTDILGIKREVVGIVEIDDLCVMLDFPQYGVKVPMLEFFTDEPEDFEVVANEIDSPDYALYSYKKRLN